MRSVGCICLVMFMGWSDRAAAGGFELYEQSPSATAMAGAVSAKADDPSAVFYNPAGIVATRGAGLILGVTMPIVRRSVQGFESDDSPIENTLDVPVIPEVFLSAHLWRRVALGLGVFSQFNADEKWPDSTAGRFPGRLVSQSFELRTFTINPVVAIHPIARVNVGVGLDVTRGTLDHTRSLTLGDQEGTMRLGGSTWAVGWNLGVLVEVVPRHLTAGFAYRSIAELGFDVPAHFETPSEVAGLVRDQHVRASLPLPHNFTVGVATKPTNRITITTDFHYVLWSAFRSFAVSFPPGSMPTLVTPLHWTDSMSLRLGFEAVALRELVLRFGAGYDFTPTPSSTLGPMMPGADRLLLSAGASYIWRGLGLNAAYLAGVSRARTSGLDEFPATYRQTEHIVSLAISYQLAYPAVF